MSHSSQTREIFIVHFKELFSLDGKNSDFSDNDLQRRNRITKLLSDWGLVDVVNEQMIEDASSISQIKILPHKEKRRVGTDPQILYWF